MLLLLLGVSVQARRQLTLAEAVALARRQSVDAAVALNELRAAYWEYRTYRADLLPEVNFSATLPSFNKSYNRYQQSDGSYTLESDDGDMDITIDPNGETPEPTLLYQD